jgi:hypothetical protein
MRKIRKNKNKKGKSRGWKMLKLRRSTQECLKNKKKIVRMKSRQEKKELKNS